MCDDKEFHNIGEPVPVDRSHLKLVPVGKPARDGGPPDSIVPADDMKIVMVEHLGEIGGEGPAKLTPAGERFFRQHQGFRLRNTTEEIRELRELIEIAAKRLEDAGDTEGAQMIRDQEANIHG